MKILYITSDYLAVGGISQHIENLTKFITKKHKVVILYINKEYEDKNYTDELGRKIYLVSNKGNQLKRFLVYPAKKIKNIIKSENPQLVHSHTIFEAIRLSIKNRKVIFTNHSSSYLKMHKNYYMKQYIFPEVMERFDLVIAPSTELFEKTHHQNKYMVANGVDLERFNLENRSKVDKKSLLNKLSIKLNTKNILVSTRRLVEKNGVYDFVKANINFFKNNNDHLYLIIGVGEEYKKIESVINDNNIENIRLLGQLENKEIDNYYYISDYCLMPSKMEAISISALEAMASGCIVLANNVGGLSELINDNQNGFFLKDLSLEKTIANLNVDKLLEIRSKAFQNIKTNYDWQKISQKTEELYESIL